MIIEHWIDYWKWLLIDWIKRGFVIDQIDLIDISSYRAINIYQY